MERAAFLLHVRPDKLPNYLEAHGRVWPPMLEALTRCGWRNYSLFLRDDDGLVFGYFEAASVADAMGAMDREDVNTQWQETMADYFDGPDGRMEPLREYFHLA